MAGLTGGLEAFFKRCLRHHPNLRKTKRNKNTEFLAARELSPAVTKGIAFGFEILFILMYTMPIELKRMPDSQFGWLSA